MLEFFRPINICHKSVAHLDSILCRNSFLGVIVLADPRRRALSLWSPEKWGVQHKQDMIVLPKVSTVTSKLWHRRL
ncbi:hypothetical protein IQ06DRAFT_122011 [Phaeosphaeriaceae sp. SRC1lsM3a]|nr:hypothetical protein IQ06DRAFT_122011 [Stagonospora sp. SRC1lsM3a]